MINFIKEVIDIISVIRNDFKNQQTVIYHSMHITIVGNPQFIEA